MPTRPNCAGRDVLQVSGEAIALAIVSVGESGRRLDWDLDQESGRAYKGALRILSPNSNLVPPQSRIALTKFGSIDLSSVFQTAKHNAVLSGRFGFLSGLSLIRQFAPAASAQPCILSLFEPGNGHICGCPRTWLLELEDAFFRRLARTLMQGVGSLL